jgi:hypothetical protein
MGFPPTPQPYQGPNYQGFVFNLVSSNGKPSHLLTISTQIGETVAHVAYLTGTWQGEKASSPMTTRKQ